MRQSVENCTQARAIEVHAPAVQQTMCMVSHLSETVSLAQLPTMRPPMELQQCTMQILHTALDAFLVAYSAAEVILCIMLSLPWLTYACRIGSCVCLFSSDLGR
eukprot:scpid107334/ scgid25740/ 